MKFEKMKKPGENAMEIQKSLKVENVEEKLPKNIESGIDEDFEKNPQELSASFFDEGKNSMMDKVKNALNILMSHDDENEIIYKLAGIVGMSTGLRLSYMAANGMLASNDGAHLLGGMMAAGGAFLFSMAIKDTIEYKRFLDKQREI